MKYKELSVIFLMWFQGSQRHVAAKNTIFQNVVRQWLYFTHRRIIVVDVDYHSNLNESK